MHRLLWLCLPLVTLLTQARVEAQSISWNIDPGHSRIGFTARHLGFAKVNGELKSFQATIKGDAVSAKLESVEATADAASVSTGIEKRDSHLKSDDFFAAAKYPTMKLKTKAIMWKGNAFTAKADLTIRNVTKEVVLEGELLGVQKVNFGQGAQLRAAYEAKTTINRKDFGLNFAGLAEGVSIVGDTVTLELSVEVSHTL